MSNNEANHLREALSALADGELGNSEDIISANVTAENLLKHMCEDPQLASEWQCMHLVRDVMQDDYHPALSPDFVAQVSKSINTAAAKVVPITSAAKPKASAPRNQSPAASVQTVVPLPRKSATQAFEQPTNDQPDVVDIPRRRVNRKSIAGFGLAASFTGAALLATQLWLSPEIEHTNNLASNENQPVEPSVSTNITDSQIIAEAKTQPALEALTLQAAMQTASSGTHWRMSEQQESPRNIDVEERLNILLTNHLEEASMGSVQGFVSHSRLVGYDTQSHAPARLQITGK